ncbi:MAG TPA: S41 family peptidase [Elusimicrobiota bacterium]|jgi:carboxyl-terminal processing protease|nr:S41 family peptidase [Elusimicrobiota bacterium]
MNMKIRRFLVLAIGVSLLAAPLRAAPAKPEGDQTYEQMKLLVDVLGYIQDNYVEDVDTQKLVYGAAEGMVRTLDPFSQFLTPDMNGEMKSETEGQFGGVGLRLNLQDDWLTVLTPMPGSPAYRLGILPDDRIAEIDGASTTDMDMDEALKRMRGAPGTTVKVKILRGPEDAGEAGWKTLNFDITRELVKIESVVSRKLDDGVGYARIIEFSAKTSDDLDDALRRLTKDGATSLVIDLRNNPGGLLSAAVECSSLFLGEGQLIVYTQGRKPESRQDFTAGEKAPYETLPMAILINGGSASASEIFAGAMQDHKRAVIVGQRSYGKASVQSLIPLPDGSGLRLTVAHYFTPNGRMIHRDGKNKNWGIMPDIGVDVTPETEAKLYEQWEMIYAKDKKPESAVKPEDMVRDDALDMAVELLKARDVLGALKPAPAPAPAPAEAAPAK